MAPTLRRGIAVLSLLLVGGLAHAQESASYDPDPPDRAARLAYIQGDVSLQPVGEDEWAPALLNRPLTTGDKLWTERGARAEIQVGQAAVRLDEGTGFSFLDLGNDTVQMRLTAGTLIVTVRALEDREHLEIDTPNMALSILRPGSYRVEVNDAGDVTTVRLGDGEAEATGGGQNVLVHSRQVVTFKGVDDLVADWSTLGDPDDFDHWSMDRERRGERVASSATAKYVSPEVTGYDDLDDHGTWSSEPEYGYVWTPTRVSVGWSPYRYGRWVWVSPWGWTWIDDSPWGYAPFHYGRWAHIRHRWCWVPGPRHIRPVFAPALVGWVGARGTYISWVPLGPRDVYVPWRHHSRRYTERVNFSNSRTLDRTQIREVFERNFRERGYHNRSAPDAVTAVPRTAFTSAQRVADRRVRFDERAMGGAQERARLPQVAPVRESRLGGSARANPRIPAAIAARQVIVKRDPPASSAHFARRPQPAADVAQVPPMRGARTQDRDTYGRQRERPVMETSPEARLSPAEQRSLPARIRESRERQAREQVPRDEEALQRGREDRLQRERPPRELRGSQYPQYDQRPQRTQDAVREAVARQLEQRERQSPRERDIERPRAEYRPQPRMEQPREQRPRMEQPRMEQPRREQPRIEQPRAERRQEAAPRQERQTPAERRSEPNGRQGDGNRGNRH